MAKVAEQVREAEDEAERRSPILTGLQDFTSMRTECAWLASYEKDDARFKVRSQNQGGSLCSPLQARTWTHMMQGSLGIYSISACYTETAL